MAEAMSHKSKSVLQRYLTKLDKGDSTVADDVEIDPRYNVISTILTITTNTTYPKLYGG